MISTTCKYTAGQQDTGSTAFKNLRMIGANLGECQYPLDTGHVFLDFLENKIFLVLQLLGFIQMNGVFND